MSLAVSKVMSSLLNVLKLGIDTTLILYPTSLNVEDEIKTKNVISADQMLDVVKKVFLLI